MRLVPGLAVRAGQTIAGRYRVETLLGSGASGVVLSARSVHLREPVVLKILASYTDDQDELSQRRMAKARVAADLQSEHVARIVDIGITEEGMPYVASESLSGHTLEVELETRGPLPVEEAVRWVLEACEGLAEAHAMGLVHGDLKPNNLFLTDPKARARMRPRVEGDELDLDADPRVLKILDFGTTSPLDGIGDQSASAFFGSPAFLAPEQIQDPTTVGPPADVWALGILLYNLVSGSLPFTADTVSGVMVAVVYDAPSLLTEGPYELARVVAACLEKDPAKRPRSVKELAAALAPFAGPQGPRLSERVAAMLDAPPIVKKNRITDAASSGAIEPVSLPAAQARLDLRRTGPSKRIVARRRSRWRRALGLLAAASLGIAAWSATRGGGGGTGAAAEGAAVGSASLLSSPPLEVPVFVPAALPDAPSVIPAPDESPPPSFAPTETKPSTPTPPVMTPTPLATAPPRPLPAAAPPVPLAAPVRQPTPSTKVVAPAPRGATTAARGLEPPRGGPPTSRLPAGLPSSREPVSSSLHAPASRPSAASPRNTPTASPTTDASYLRSLFSERK